MKKEIEAIVFINRYLANHKNDYKKKELVRGYLTSKVNSISSKFYSVNSKRDFITELFNIPLVMLSF
jgi:hypothetical protein